MGDDGEGQETGEEGELQLNRSGGPEGEGAWREKPGAADVLISGSEETGRVSSEGEQEI